ncbi:MAG: hypothetical protein U9Q61_05700, partial [Thermodesulfobacteriota bacterium]|nr:hypothetical protein [Thermodesulfobacteriota bacterium]
IKYQNNYLFDEKETNEKYSIEYNKYDSDKIKDNLFYRFKQIKLKEIKYGYTLAGPHIDDFVFLINNNNISKYSSEGQKRSFLLSYKQAQLQDYKDNYGYYPILLFDDMGRELDSSRKSNIFKNILNNSGQIFITTMDVPDIEENSAKIFQVNNGDFSEFKFD